jgi:acylglycerol lipase
MDQIAHDEGHFQVDGGLRLYYQRWRPATTETRAVIILLHGDFAHSGWYMNLPTHEAPRGYAVYACDRRGWGRSPGQRGYIHSWGENLGDLDVFMRLVHAEEPGRPIFLMGHTGSGPIVLDYAAQHPSDIRGVFCISPVLNTSAAIPAPLHALLVALSRIAPRLTIDVRRRFDASAEWVSHDPAFVTFIREDPLGNTKVTPRWLVESERGMRRVREGAPRFTVSLLVLVGEADRTSSPASTKAYFERVGAADKTLIEYPGAYTNLLSDTDYEQALADIDAWLDRHV